MRNVRPRSVFGNFKSEICDPPADDQATAPPSVALGDASPLAIGDLQSAIDASVARAFLYRFLAKAFEDPTDEGWWWLTNPEIQQAFKSSVEALSAASLSPPRGQGQGENSPNRRSAHSPNEPTSARERLGVRQSSGASAADVADARSRVSPVYLHVPVAKAPEDWRTPKPGSLSEVHGEGSSSELLDAAKLLAAQLLRDSFEAFKSDYLAAFGHAARGLCPLNEIEYGDIKADPLFQPHRLADLAAFYRAFGLELASDATERHDHICLELEFMSVLAAKEAYALEHQLDGDQLALCRDAQKKFLREHLGRWTPAFTRRLAKMVGEDALGALANFTRQFVATECARFGLPPGSEDLLLRPVDAAAESICASCGITNLPPGALRTDA